MKNLIEKAKVLAVDRYRPKNSEYRSELTDRQEAAYVTGFCEGAVFEKCDFSEFLLQKIHEDINADFNKRIVAFEILKWIEEYKKQFSFKVS